MIECVKYQLKYEKHTCNPSYHHSNCNDCNGNHVQNDSASTYWNWVSDHLHSICKKTIIESEINTINEVNSAFQWIENVFK